MSKIPTPQEYYDMLQSHDWTYMMSDDHRSYTRGSAREAELKAMYKDRPELKELYDGFYNYIWSGAHMNTEKAEMPKRPE